MGFYCFIILLKWRLLQDSLSISITRPTQSQLYVSKPPNSINVKFSQWLWQIVLLYAYLSFQNYIMIISCSPIVQPNLNFEKKIRGQLGLLKRWGQLGIPGDWSFQRILRRFHMFREKNTLYIFFYRIEVQKWVWRNVEKFPAKKCGKIPCQEIWKNSLQRNVEKFVATLCSLGNHQKLFPTRWVD